MLRIPNFHQSKYLQRVSSRVCQVLRFANGAKLYSKINRTNNGNDLMKDLDKLETWPEKWQMPFHCDKCKCLHLGHGNANLTRRYRHLGERKI